MDGRMAAVDDLITEAAALVERPTCAGDAHALALVHDALAAAVADCDDATVAADAKDVLTLLDRVVRSLERRPDLPLAS